jgi:hypothetical protein
MQLTWQYEDRDCYMKNVETDEFVMSTIFRDRVFDLNAWTMGPDFFSAYPELRAYISARNEISRSLPDPITEPSSVEVQQVTDLGTIIPLKY